MNTLVRKERGGDPKDSLPSFLGFISNVFDPYLSAFVNSEKQNFGKLLERAVKGDDLVKGGELPVLQGAVKLFQYLKETLSRCATMSTGQTLVAMSVYVCGEALRQRGEGDAAAVPGGAGGSTAAHEEQGQFRRGVCEVQEERRARRGVLLVGVRGVSDAASTRRRTSRSWCRSWRR